MKNTTHLTILLLGLILLGLPALDVRAQEDDEWDEELEEFEFEPECSQGEPRKTGDVHRSCGTKGKTCAVWRPSKSDSCTAMENRSPGVEVHYDYFGDTDCRTSRRRDEEIDMIVLHNGDHARGNTRTWQCRPAAAHYTINRDGKIYQHVGEELSAWHAGSTAANRRSIGIELQTLRGHGSSCNSLRGRRLSDVAEKEGVGEADIIVELCGPTFQQYSSLSSLIDDIRSRHDVTEIVGHCELVGPGGHGDPRAFDWSQILMSNADKQEFAESHETACGWYHIY